jgi:hypothetical protein
MPSYTTIAVIIAASAGPGKFFESLEDRCIAPQRQRHLVIGTATTATTNTATDAVTVTLTAGKDPPQQPLAQSADVAPSYCVLPLPTTTTTSTSTV